MRILHPTFNIGRLYPPNSLLSVGDCASKPETRQLSRPRFSEVARFKRWLAAPMNAKALLGLQFNI